MSAAAECAKSGLESRNPGVLRALVIFAVPMKILLFVDVAGKLDGSRGLQQNAMTDRGCVDVEWGHGRAAFACRQSSGAMPTLFQVGM